MTAARRWWAAAALAALFAASATRPVDAAPPPVEHFTKRPQIDSVVVSPSGKRLALLTFAPNGRRRMAVMDLVPPGPPRVVAGFADADVASVHWVHEDRLVFHAFERGALIRSGGGGLFAVNHDGSDQRQLIAWRPDVSNSAGTLVASRVLPYGWFFGGTIDDDSNDIFVYKRLTDSVGDVTEFVMARLDTVSRTVKHLALTVPPGTRDWLLDETRVPRLLSAYRDGRTHIYLRDAAAGWKELTSFDPLGEGAFQPWHIDGDGRLLVLAYGDGGVEGLYRFDLEKRVIDPEPLLRVGGYDLSPTKEVDSRSGRLLGVHFTVDRPMSYWFDESLRAIQEGIDAALPAHRSNLLYCGRCESTRFFVVRSSSDAQPGEYFLYDRQKKSLESLGASRPWIDEAMQGRRTLHRVTARDGLTLPLYVTHPPGAAPDTPLPAVVLVHGGPWVRGASLAWDAEAQFLASRGYRVLQPEFRGSTGYGMRHFKSGWKQWGRAMQDDLADAVKWAARQGLVDPARVCIMGASYGGYAALMSPILHPGVYRCAVSFAGVTDIGLMYSVHWSDASDMSRRYSMPVMIGDPQKDASLLDAASPVKRAAEIRIPVLLVHGGVDRRVPIVHARRFASAAKGGGVALEEVDYLDEGHHFFIPDNASDFYRRVERFLHDGLREADVAGQAATGSGASRPR